MRVGTESRGLCWSVMCQTVLEQAMLILVPWDGMYMG